MSTKTEHAGARDSARKSGFDGRGRMEAKEFSKVARRRRDQEAIEEQLRDDEETRLGPFGSR